MCCCNNQCCCNCCCGNSCGNDNSGINSLPSWADTSYPVYVSIPTFLWNNSEDGNGCSCGCRG